MTLDERKIYTEKLAEKLPTLRKELGVSQQALADILNRGGRGHRDRFFDPVEKMSQ